MPDAVLTLTLAALTTASAAWAAITQHRLKRMRRAWQEAHAAATHHWKWQQRAANNHAAAVGDEARRNDRYLNRPLPGSNRTWR